MSVVTWNRGFRVMWYRGTKVGQVTAPTPGYSLMEATTGAGTAITWKYDEQAPRYNIFMSIFTEC